MNDVRFESAVISFAGRQIVDELVEAICTGANAEGIMASGHAGRVRLAAGPDVERELRAQAPLLIGDAYLTGPGNLAEGGVRYIAHVVSNEAPGAPVQRAAVERGLERAFELLDRAGVRSVAVPDMGMRIPNMSVESAAALVADALSRRLRRGATLEKVSVASLDEGYLLACRARLIALGATEI